jgi:hypothetical protein
LVAPIAIYLVMDEDRMDVTVYYAPIPASFITSCAAFDPCSSVALLFVLDKSHRFLDLILSLFSSDHYVIQNAGEVN